MNFAARVEAERPRDGHDPGPRGPPTSASDERRRHGQHYTQPPIVDLINAFSIRAGTDIVLDPACGAGVFLVRAHARKQYLQPALSHPELLAALHGCDLLDHACQLSARNLAASVTRAQAHGGGLVTFVFHRIRDDKRDQYATSPKEFTRFIDWLARQQKAKKVVVKPLGEVVGGRVWPVPGDS